jgi:hypothetical protein
MEVPRASGRKFCLRKRLTCSVISCTMTAFRHDTRSNARELRQIAANGPEATPATDRFQIIINLGADVVERYDKSIAVNPNDVDRFNDIGATPQGLLTVIAAKKKDDDSGGPL